MDFKKQPAFFLISRLVSLLSKKVLCDIIVGVAGKALEGVPGMMIVQASSKFPNKSG